MHRSRTRRLHGVELRGVGIGARTQCAHYSSHRDIIAIRFKCCDIWYPCIHCHRATADHEAIVWPLVERGTPAVLCGACGRQLTVAAYLGCDAACPGCGAAFNPGCATHHHFYFEVVEASDDNRGVGGECHA